MRLAIIGNCGYWPYTSGRSVRLYTDGCVVDSSTGLMGPCMDIKIAEVFNESRQNSKIRDAQLAMPTSKIPDLGWQFNEDIQLVEPVTEQIYSLEPIQEKAQTVRLTPTAPPMEEETAPVQLVEETATETVPTEAVEIQAVQTPKIEECQINLLTPMVFKFLAVLKPVVATVTQQITNKTHF